MLEALVGVCRSVWGARSDAPIVLVVLLLVLRIDRLEIIIIRSGLASARPSSTIWKSPSASSSWLVVGSASRKRSIH
eukprot:4000798-Prymnesium_polylepis.1